MRRFRWTRLAAWTLAALLVVPNAWAGEIGRVQHDLEDLLPAEAP